MTRQPATTSFFGRKRRGAQIMTSVHTILSKRQRAYSVFQPAPDTDFPLFQVVRILTRKAERPNSPRNTQVNLKTIFEGLSSNPNLPAEDRPVIEAFVREFNRTAHQTGKEKLPEIQHVSLESLSRAGIDLSSPTGIRIGFSFSSARSTSRQISLKHHFSDAYDGSELHTLIRNNAKPVFSLILGKLPENENFPSARGQRRLLAIVTTRIVSTIGLDTTAQTRCSAVFRMGDEARNVNGEVGGESTSNSKEGYKNLYGVSGLRLIVFPVECVEEDTWRIYAGIPVHDSDISEDDETFTEDTRKNDSFYMAQKWELGDAELLHSANPTTVKRSLSLQMTSWSLCPVANIIFSTAMNDEDDSDRRTSRTYVDVSLTNTLAPCVEVNIRPLLNDFARKQFRLASYYRRTAIDDSKRLAYAVNVLRHALRIFCFESTVRALYDLSSCYRYGLRVNLDFGMAKLLRYCASELRRNYDSRSIWLKRIALEVMSYPSMATEHRIISLMLFHRHTVTSFGNEMDSSRLECWLTVITLPSNVAQEERGNHYSCEPSYVTSRRDQRLLHEDNNKVGVTLWIMDHREFRDTSKAGVHSRELRQQRNDQYRTLLEGMDNREVHDPSQQQESNKGICMHFDNGDGIAPMELNKLICRNRNVNAKTTVERLLETFTVLLRNNRGMGNTVALKRLCSIKEIDRPHTDGVCLIQYGMDVNQLKLSVERRRIVEIKLGP